MTCSAEPSVGSSARGLLAGPALGRAAAIGAAAVAVAVVGIAAAGGNPVSSQPYVPGQLTGEPQPTDPLAPPPPEPSDTPAWLRWLLDGFVLLCLVALVVTIVVLAVRLLYGRDIGLIRRRVLEPDELELLTIAPVDVDMIGRDRGLEDAVEQSMAELAAGGDVRTAVIAAWLRLEEAASAAGTPRRDDDAPGDLVGRLLATHEVRPRRLEVLAELYRRARYSPSPLQERDRDDAQRALVDVRADLMSAGQGASTAGLPRSGAAEWPTRWT